MEACGVESEGVCHADHFARGGREAFFKKQNSILNRLNIQNTVLATLTIISNLKIIDILIILAMSHNFLISEHTKT